MARSTYLLLGCGALAACSASQPRPDPAPHPSAPVDAGVAAAQPSSAPLSTALPEAAVEPPPGPCELMRSTGESDDVAYFTSRLRDRSLERAIHRFYMREVLGRGIDNRSPVEHPLVFDEVVTANAAVVAPCVDQWRGADPHGVLPGGTGHFIAHHKYVEVNFAFDDATDGMNAFTVFVDVATLEVVAAFRYANSQP